VQAKVGQTTNTTFGPGKHLGGQGESRVQWYAGFGILKNMLIKGISFLKRPQDRAVALNGFCLGCSSLPKNKKGQ